MTDDPLAHALTADALDGVAHAFFTRHGGVSTGPFASLNCGIGSHDGPDAVASNRRRAAEALGVAPDALATPVQTHGAEAVVAERARPLAERPRADAVVTATPGLAVGVLTADCAPVLLADRAAGVVGAAHAGWRGALGGIVEAAVARMEALGADRARIAAAIGPCIGAASYAVSADFPKPFLHRAAANRRFFVPVPESAGFRFDLRGYVLARLQTLGLGATTALAGDTLAEPARFFSYRRARREGAPDHGRMLAAIAREAA